MTPSTRTPTTRRATTTTRSRSRPTGDNAAAKVRVSVGDAGQRLGHEALPRTRTATASPRTTSRSSARARQGTTDFEEIRPPATRRCGQEVRAARDQLRRRPSPTTVDDHLRGAAAVPARPGRELHAHVRAATGRCSTTQPVLVERGEVEALGAVPGGGAEQPAPVDDVRPPTACAAHRRASPRSGCARSGRGVRLDLTPRAGGAGDRVACSSSRADAGSPASSSSRASRTGRGSFTWNGKATPGRMTDGYYFVRYRLGERHAAGRRCGAATGGSRRSATSTGARRATWCRATSSSGRCSAARGRCARDLVPASRSRRG